MKDEENSGRFFPDYPYERISSMVNFTDSDNITNLRILIDSLHEGCGVILGVRFLSNGSVSGGHAISCRDYVVNNDYSEDDYRHYEALIVSDSDSDMQMNPERRIAPNKLRMLDMTSVYFNMLSRSSNVDFFCWLFPNYMSGGVLTEAAIIKPVSGVDPNFTETGTKDKKNNIDLSVNGITLCHFNRGESFPDGDCTTFFKGETIFCAPRVRNNSYVAYD